jgi:spermidine/putrescine transport system permease protein
MRRIPLSLWLGAGMLFVFLYTPIAVVFVYSFNAAKYGGPWVGFTFDWYRRLLDSPEKLNAAWNTLVLAVVSTAVSTVLGAALGYGLSRYRFSGKRLFSWLLFVPVVIPDIVMAVAMLALYTVARDWLGLFELGLTTMILAHITFQIPFVAVVVRSRLAGLDPAIEEAAHDLGANAWQKFWYVTLPLMWPGVLAGAALAFTLSIDDFVVSFFTTGPGATTLPILIYASVKRGITPDINALSTLIVLLSILGTVTVTFLQRRGSADKSPS